MSQRGIVGFSGTARGGDSKTRFAAFDLARTVAREQANTLDKPRIANAQVIAAIERLARADRRHAATTDVWDAHPWLLNTPGRIVDLRTRIMPLPDPDCYMTKITAVKPDGDCPQWLAFLAKITGNKAELQQYLQRVAGYCLTGITREQVLFFLYGHGSNGKSVFLSTLSQLFGD